MTDVQFKISSNLKNLIWKELITDDYIAIFELVKNSYDAHAKNVTISFENDKIIIEDDWKGMSEDDIKDKWLFVWYSAKANNEEDKNYSYRDKIKRTFAWAKWVGRFACDRLGEQLILLSKSEKESSISQLEIYRNKFEEDAKQEFVNITADLNKGKSKDFELKHGTKLIISNLRTIRTREKKLLLKKSLSKLIDPLAWSDDSFNITIDSSMDLKWDKWVEHYYEKVNGSVINFIFDKLWIKTTNISVKIRSNWNEILSVLEDRGDMIYEILEKNEDYNEFIGKELEISVKLYYLNAVAKRLFKQEMGVDSVSFWSVFVYKNGFRIYPFWEWGDDTFKIDRRKTQGHSRYIWTRELIWSIQIHSSHNYFQETTSRDWWFIKNDIVQQLEVFLIQSVLKKLEAYTVDTLDWTYNVWENTELAWEDRKESILELLAKITKSKNVISSKINNKLIAAKVTQEKEKWWIEKAKKIALAEWNTELVKELTKVDKTVKLSIKQKEEAEKERDDVALENMEIKEQKWEIERRLYFQEWIITEDKKSFLDYFHQIGINSGTIKNTIASMLKIVEKEKDNKDYELLVGNINKLHELIWRVLVITKFATKANFKADSTKITENLVDFIKQYLENISTLQGSHKVWIEIMWIDVKFIREFVPIKIAIILDNLLSNAKKAYANNIMIEFIWSWKKLKIIFSDDWEWLNKNIKNIFDFWVTTTYWSWIGLNTVKRYIEEDFGWNIEVYDWKKNYLKWATFVLTLNK